MTSPTMALAEFAAGLTLDKIPATCADKVKQALLDTIGCVLFGSTTPWSRTLNSLVMEQGGKEEATLWACSFRGPASNVALSLGTMAHSFELDDYHSGAKLHPGAAVIPAAIPLAEVLGSSGRDLLTATVAGYEAIIRLSLATGTVPARLRGWHLTGICGTIGAAAAGANLLRLDPHLTANALGLAGTQSAGLFAFNAEGANSKRLHPGRAAQSGVLAVLLAQRGFTGPTTVLEYEDGGFCKAYSDRYDLSEITRELGERFEAERVSFKPYACCGSTHSSIDATLEIVRKHALSAESIAKIKIYNSSVVERQCSWPYTPGSALQAQMNIEYCVAVAATDGGALPQQFAPEKLAHPRIVDLARRTAFVVDEEIDRIYPTRFPGKVEVFTKDGERYISEVPGPRGSPQNPMTWDEVASKFRILSDGVIGAARAQRVADLVRRIEDLRDVRELTEVLR